MSMFLLGRMPIIINRNPKNPIRNLTMMLITVQMLRFGLNALDLLVEEIRYPLFCVKDGVERVVRAWNPLTRNVRCELSVRRTLRNDWDNS